jgi:hypothetical protein
MTAASAAGPTASSLNCWNSSRNSSGAPICPSDGVGMAR